MKWRKRRKSRKMKLKQPKILIPKIKLVDHGSKMLFVMKGSKMLFVTKDRMKELLF